MDAHPGPNGAVGRLARQGGKPDRKCGAELADKVDDRVVGHLLDVVDEAAGSPQVA